LRGECHDSIVAVLAELAELAVLGCDGVWTKGIAGE